MPATPHTDTPNCKSIVAHVFTASSILPICAADLLACSLANPRLLLLAFFTAQTSRASP
jgi:hypothetical protein